MKKYSALLWDIDGTLLDFTASETAGIRKCFTLFSLGECSDTMLFDYSRINTKYWERLERGECTKHETMIGRFREFFDLYGLKADPVEFNSAYQDSLPETVVFRPGALEALNNCAKYYKQYCITNGNAPVQHRKLRASGLDCIFTDAFISDEIGYEKPSPQYFKFVLDSVGLPPEKVLIIGDSLTSDIKGANLSLIPCCWYNPEQHSLPDGYHVDLSVRHMNELIPLLCDCY